jgi:hypothetical protein
VARLSAGPRRRRVALHRRRVEGLMAAARLAALAAAGAAARGTARDYRLRCHR